MFEDSGRTGYMDILLAVIGLAALLFNIEVGFILLVWAMYIYVTNRLPSFHRVPLLLNGKHRAKPHPRRTRHR